MSLALTPEQDRDLREAILDAFSPADLPIAVHDHVEVHLHNLVAPGPFPAQVFELIAACRRRGWLDRLVFGVIAERGDNPKVIDLARRLGVHPAGAPGGFEKLVGANRTLVDPLPWLSRCGAAAARVCQVRWNGQKQGSGFLVGPDAVLTCHHVVAGALDNPGELAFVFDYARTATGDIDDGMTFAGKQVLAWSATGPKSQFDESPAALPGEGELDMALVQLTRPAGKLGFGDTSKGRTRGWIAVPAAAYDFASHAGLAILQHPYGHPVKLGLDFADRGRPITGAPRVRYTIPTEKGSSGSPVFGAESLTLVALHHGGMGSFNQGVPTSAIAAHPDVKAYLATVPPQ
jgi:trypsin-like peptidase/effector-associated domain 1 (EAD1)-containing protein